jgi:hypothetical protein
MKTRVLSWMMVSLLFAAMTGLCRAETDNRVIGKLGENSSTDTLRRVSLYMTFDGVNTDDLTEKRSGDKTRFYSQVWDGLYLQVFPTLDDEGVAAYQFYFSADEAGKDVLDVTDSAPGPAMGEVAAADFRSDDNLTTRPLTPGPGTPQDRGSYRVIHYDGFDAVIRVLEFEIGNIHPNAKPDFRSLSCLVTVAEKPAAK